MDLDLPDSTKEQTLKFLSQICDKFPIIVITSQENHKLTLKSVSYGAQDFLIKDHLDQEILGKSICYAIERFKIKRNLNKTNLFKQKIIEIFNDPKQRFKLSFDVHITLKNIQRTIGAQKVEILKHFKHLKKNLILESSARGEKGKIRDCHKNLCNFQSLNQLESSFNIQEKNKKSFAIKLYQDELDNSMVFITLHDIKFLRSKKEINSIMTMIADHILSKLLNHNFNSNVALTKDISEFLSHSFSLKRGFDFITFILNTSFDFDDIYLCQADKKQNYKVLFKSNTHTTDIKIEELDRATQHLIRNAFEGKKNISVFYQRKKGQFSTVATIKLNPKNNSQLVFIIKANKLISSPIVFNEFLETTANLFEDFFYRIDYEQQLKQTNKNKEQFIATMSHELRNPLSVIKTGIEILELETSNKRLSKFNELLSVMKNQSKMLERLVEDLFDISRIKTSKLTVSKEPVQLLDILNQAIITYQDQIKKKHLKLTININEDHIVLGDQIRLIQVFGNLLSNSIKHLPEKGEIEIKVISQDKEFTSIAFSDNGPGIEKDIVHHIFKPFLQDSRAQGGLGLGLYLVHQIIELHGGTITLLFNKPGANFLIRIPTCHSKYMPHEKHDSLLNENNNLNIDTKILIIDDNIDLNHFLNKYLTKHKYKVFSEYNGKEGLKNFKQNQPEIIILDINMPEMNGFEVAKKIKEINPSTSIIAFTGVNTAANKRQAKEAGFSYFLPKDTEISKLLSYLQKITKNKRKKKNIVWIDDNEDFLTIAQKALGNTYSVTCYSQTEKLIQNLRSLERIDLILLDYLLYYQTGDEIASIILDDPVLGQRLTNKNVLLVTGYRKDSPQISQAKKNFRVINKPNSTKELREIISNYV